MPTAYDDFLAAKALKAPLRGLTDLPTIGTHLFPFQAECVRFGLRAGSFGLFLDTGLGKTLCELEWATHASAAMYAPALILTPLAVARQIEAEGLRFGYTVRVIRGMEDVGAGINVCNYDRLEKLDPQVFGAIALDEASILKNFTGKMSQSLIDAFAQHRFKMAATATPAPNDHTELAQHAAFLNVLTRSEMLVRFFINDSGDTGTWRLKGHAVTPFFDWMASWSRMAEHPRDLGDDIAGFDLPELVITRHRATEPETPIGGGLFGGAVSATEIFKVKKQTAAARADVAVSIVTESWGIRWTNQNDGDQGATPSMLSVEPTSQIQTQDIEPRSWNIGGSGESTRPESLNNVSSIRLVSNTKTSLPCSPTKMARAPFVGHASRAEGASSTLTTATTPESSEDFSATDATSGSGTSRTILKLLNERPTIYDIRKLEPWILWCDTNAEQEILERNFGPLCVSVKGSDSIDSKESAVASWLNGDRPILLSKTSIVGYGMNFQRCNHMLFVGRTFSYEAWYQAVRRCWRFGQTRKVRVHLVVAEGEDAIGRVIDRKADDHGKLKKAMTSAMRRAIGAEKERRVMYEPTHTSLHVIGDTSVQIQSLSALSGYGFSAIHGDCVSVVRQLPDACVGLSIYSPPFSNLFVYSDSAADMGNAGTDDEFLEHYGFLLRELARVTKPGRLTAVHCSDLPLQKWKDGVIGIKDLSGDIIRAHEAAGWTLHARITIWKSPVVEMTRTKALGLLYKQLQKDSSRSRTGMADYLLVFIRDGVNADPIAHRPEEFNLEQWQEWASPVWMTVRQTRTLNVDAAREDKDERHLCPLQLDVIERALTLWSNPDDVVLSPFMGIGSEGVTAMKMNRRFLGIELKASYFTQACEFLSAADNQLSLLDTIDTSPSLGDF